jgi:hypothetical protein
MCFNVKSFSIDWVVGEEYGEQGSSGTCIAWCLGCTIRCGAASSRAELVLASFVGSSHGTRGLPLMVRYFKCRQMCILGSR